MIYEDAITQGGEDITSQFKPPIYEEVMKQGGVDITPGFKTPTYEDTIKQGGMDITKEFAPETKEKPELAPSHVPAPAPAPPSWIPKIVKQLTTPSISTEPIPFVPTETIGKPVPIEEVPVISTLKDLKVLERPRGYTELSFPELLGTVEREPKKVTAGQLALEHARASNIMAINKEFPKFSPTFIEQNYDALTKELGLRTKLTNRELIDGLFKVGIGAGLIVAPLATLAGVATFMGVKEIESLAVQLKKGEKPQVFAGRELMEFLGPLEEHDKAVVETLEYVVPGLLSAKVMGITKAKLSKELSKKLIHEAWDDAISKVTESEKGRLLEFKGKIEETKALPSGVAKVPEIAKPELTKPIIKPQEVPLEMVPEGLVKPEVKVEALKPTEPFPIEEVTPKAPPVKGEGVKQPWEMTREEYKPQFRNVTYDKETNKYTITSSEKPISKITFIDTETGNIYSGVTHAEIANAVNKVEKRNLEANVKTQGFLKEGRFIDRNYKENVVDPHKMVIEKALSEGKPVPPEVLKDYPELVKPEEIKPIKVSPVKPKVIKEPSGDILSWVRSKGGIDPDTVSADVKELTQKESGFKGKSSLVRKGGRGLDELAQEWGWERGGEISTDELSDAIKDAVQSKRKGVPRKLGVGSTEQEIDRHIRRQEEDRYRNQIYDSDPNIAKDETFKTLTESFDDEIMGFKEELREDGYSEADITRTIGQTQKDIEIEARPTNITEFEKEVRSLLSPKVETPPAKELWQMTWDEARSPEVGGTLGRFQESIKKAYSEGKPIPQGNLEFLTNRELKELKPKPSLSPTAKDQFALPGIRQGLEMKGAKEVTPTLEGTPLGEAARKVEMERVQPKLFGKPVPEKTISQFTTEYKEGLGEAGYIRIGGVEKVTPKVVTPGTKDVALPEFGLTTLHVGDRHPFLKPIIEANIKAEQNTNNWILRNSDKISGAFDKVERPSVWQWVFGRRGTDIRDLDLMIEGKKPVPEQLTGFVTDIKGILGDIKGEVIQKMKDDFADSLSPKQKEYLDWVQNGKVGDKPKYVRAGTIKAVDEAQTQFNEMEKWGIQDYFPHIFKGRYKYLTEDGHIIASGQTAKQAKANFEEYVESHPETAKKTFMFVNDFYDLMTVRKVLNPELTNPLEYLGTRLSRKEFFRLLGRTEKVIKEEIANAGVDDIPKVKVDMSGIASFQKGTKFSGHFLKRRTSLRGEETDPFRALSSYVFSVGRKLGLEDAKKASYAFADSLPTNMPNAKSYIKMQADNMSGRYNIIDRLFDETIGEKLGMKPFGASRIIAKGVALESKLKLGYAPAKTAVNRMGGVFHTILQEGGKNYYEGRKLLKAKDPELIRRIQEEGHLAGMEQLFAGEGLIGVSEKQTSWWRPLGTYQMAEVKNRSEALASGYVAGLKKFSGDKDAAWIYAIDSAKLTQGLYNTAAKPVLVRGPIAGATYQFKQYLNNEIRFMSQLTPGQWAGYITGIVASAGTRGALLTIKSIIGISIIGLGIDELMERLNRKAPHLHRGIFGLIGIDVSAPASWQIPTQVMDWIGAFPKDVIATGQMIIKRLQNNGWTDEDINNYVRQITPVGYNIFKGLQMLSEGVTKEGTKVIYKGGKEEGVINLAGAKSVSQSQASDSARYMNQQRKLFLEKSKVLEDRLFGSKSREEAENTFKELVELKNIQTPEEIQDFINGLRRSAISRVLTEEARIFMTLPRTLRKEEIRKR